MRRSDRGLPVRPCTAAGQRGLRVAALALAVATALTGTAQAQSDGLDEIKVTGTRIRRTEYESVTATQTITEQDMERLGLVSAADMLAQLPSNVGLYTLDTTGDQSFFVGATLANLRGLNTAFGTRTLTLVDGRRFVSTTNGGGVDLSFIPSILIGRMETVTGGASAVYGSDATAGVVNIILDRNVQGLRLDASYGQNQDGYFKNYSASVASGVEVLKGRGDITVSYEHQVTDPVPSCAEVLDWCRRSMAILQTHRTGNAEVGCGFFPACPFLGPIPESALLFPDQDFPAWQVFDGARYLHTGNTRGVIHTNNKQPWSATNGTFLQFTPDGTDVEEWQSRQNGLDGFWREYAYSGGPSTLNERTRNPTIFAGEGQLITDSNVLRNGQERDNIFTRFVWDVTDDIRLNAQVSYGKTDGQTFQNSAQFHQDTICVYLPVRDAAGAITSQNFTSGADATFRDWGGPNAFFTMMSPAAQQALLDRARNDANTGNMNCSISNTIQNGIYGVTRQGANILKNWKDQVDRGVRTETEVKRASVGATGPLFKSNNWTWDANIQFGESDRWQQLYNNRSNFRFQFAIDSVIDPITNEPVCRVNSSGPEGQAVREAYIAYWMGEPWSPTLSSLPGYAAAKERMDALSANCVPLNPFGLAADPAALAYAWDDLTEFTYSDQTVWSISFSGEFWKGFGAGPLTMAAGIDYRDEETVNAVGGDPNPWIRTDFTAQYGDPWTGGTKATEAFAEFELPLVRDRVGARYMSLNFTGRRTKNNTFREATANEDPYDVNRYGDAWRASLNWATTDWMRVRATKSADVRSPAPRELFYRQTYSAFNQGGAFSPNPWRTQDPGGDQWLWVIGANPNLKNEQSTTRTLGVVFSPRGIASGLQLSLDYNEITVSGGISYSTGFDPENDENLQYQIFRCFEYGEPFYCSQIEFNPAGSPEEPNVDGLDPYEDCEVGMPCAARTDIVSIINTQENTEDYWNRGLDLSASYSLRLNGGGSIAMRMLATRALEANRCTQTQKDRDGNTICLARENYVGVTGSASGGGLANYASQPKWSGNLYATYSRNAFSITGQARYTGAGVVSLTDIGPEDPRWAPELFNTRSINKLPSWTVWSLTTNYNFAASRFAPDRWENLQLSLTIDNVFDKQPGFWSGGGTGGVNRRFFSSNGRTYRLNFRSAF